MPTSDHFDCFYSYEDQQRRLVEEIETLKEQLQKYSEVHALDARSNNEKDSMVRSLQDEIARLRNQMTPRSEEIWERNSEQI